MKKNLIVTILSLILVFSTVTLAVAEKKSDNNACDIKTLKVVVGTCNSDDYENYVERTKQKLNTLATDDPHRAFDALVVFNEFLPVKDVENIINDSVECKRIWLANPGYIGIGTSKVYTNDLGAAMKKFLNSFNQYTSKRLKSNDASEALKINSQAAKQEQFEIYAILVSDEVSNLNNISNHPSVRAINLHYCEEAEREKSQDTTLQVKYIDIPVRPDGVK